MSSAFDGMEELVQEFAVESRELLEEVESKLIELERARTKATNASRGTLDAVFRAFHTIKGTAGFLGFSNIVSVAHVSENLLDDLRNERATISEKHVTVLVDAVDFLREGLNLVTTENTESALSNRTPALVAAISAVGDAAVAAHSAKPAPAAAPAKATGPAASPAKTPEPVVATSVKAPEPVAAPVKAPEVAAPAFIPQVVAPQAFGNPEPAAAQAAVATLRLAEPEVALHNLFAQAPEAEAAEPTPEPEDAQNAAEANDNRTDEKKPSGEEAGRKTIRVDVDKLDALINLVGELILAENMVAHDEAVAGLQLDGFQKALMQLNRVTRGLHDIVMAVRMVPIEGLFRKMHRVVRDVSMRLGKDVELVVTGEGTEIDKNLVEHIGDPLMHIMRNALDHGIENPDVRTASGKRPVGTIRLDARHNGGEVWISVSDDGRGLNREKILEKAVERGLVDHDYAQTWPDSKVFQLVFQPGFSTADVVTEVSGRGVGMDVVWRNLQLLKGKIEITSNPGEGATFTLRIPLTLAIIEGMLVEVSGARYIIPMLSIRELVRVRPGMIHQLPDGREVAKPRDQLMGLVRLTDLHSLARNAHDEGTLVVIEHDGVQMALMVDMLLGQRQTVIKPLPDYLGEMPGISGCSILSNGDISLILELADLFRSANNGSRHTLSHATAA